MYHKFTFPADDDAANEGANYGGCAHVAGCCVCCYCRFPSRRYPLLLAFDSLPTISSTPWWSFVEQPCDEPSAQWASHTALVFSHRTAEELRTVGDVASQHLSSCCGGRRRRRRWRQRSCCRALFFFLFVLPFPLWLCGTLFVFIWISDNDPSICIVCIYRGHHYSESICECASYPSKPPLFEIPSSSSWTHSFCECMEWMLGQPTARALKLQNWRLGECDICIAVVMGIFV